jgi:glyoxylase I family protein
VARVTGIGGFFFRARDPEALNRWYAEHLGVVLPTGSYDDPGWFLERGETVFTAFSADSEAFGAPDKTWKINFRVSDLDGMVKQLRAVGIDVQPHDREYPMVGSLSSKIQRPTASSSGSPTPRRSLATKVARSPERRDGCASDEPLIPVRRRGTCENARACSRKAAGTPATRVRGQRRKNAATTARAINAKGVSADHGPRDRYPLSMRTRGATDFDFT